MIRSLCFVIVSLLAAGCVDEPCDPDQELINGLCMAKAAPAADAGADGGMSVAFNTVCTSTDQCGGETNLCAIQPGQTTGFCTHDGCTENPSVCKAGMSCLDLASYGAPGMSICIGG